MRTILLITMCLILSASTLFAGINSGGFVGSPTSITFSNSTAYSSGNQEEYLSSVAGVYACPKPADSQTMILHELNPRTGEITCYLYDEVSTDPVAIYKQNASSQELILSESASFNDFIKSGNYKHIQIRDRFGMYEFNAPEQGYLDKFVQFFDLSELTNDNDTIKNFMKETVESDKSAFSSTSIALDSYSNSERVLSNILTGLITLNPDFFEVNSLVNENGTIALKDYAIMSEKTTSDEGIAAAKDDRDGWVRAITRAVTGDFTEEAYNKNITTLVGFIDRKFWGFYAYLIYNLKEAYISILGTMMLFGGSFVLGSFGYKRMKQKINKDGEDQDKGKLASKSMDIFLVVSMFLIPITTNTAKIPDTFLYTKSNTSFSTTQTSKDADELFTHSTLSSNLIRYFANMGSTWANVVNDYALYSYLRYLESKQKSITTAGLGQNDADIQNLYTQVFYLKKDYEFYINVCRSSFQSVLATATRFNSISQEAKESFLNNTINLTGTPIYDKLGYNKINPLLCVTLEEKISVASKKALGDFSRIQMELQISKKIINNYNSESEGEFKSYVNFIQFISNNYGWISAAVVPPSYSLLFNSGEGNFAYDVAQKSLTNTDGNNLSQSWAGNTDEAKKIDDTGYTWSFVTGAIGFVTKQFIWFVMPGFDPIYQTMYKYITSISYLDPTYYQQKDDKKNGIVEAAALVKGGAMGVVWKVIKSTLKVIGTPLIYLLVMLLAVYLSMLIYVTLITTVTMLVVGGAITIKITLYFMELLLYYFLSDAILFISIVTQKNDYFIKFLSKGLVITLLTPLLTVLSVYVYLLFNNLAIEMYSMIISSIYEVSIMQNEAIVAESGSGAVTSAFQSVAMASTKYFGEVVILLFSLIIGTTTIFKFKDWVFKMIGIEEAGFSSAMSAEISGKITGGMNPVK